MLNIGNKIRFGHQIYNVLKIKNDDILIENNNIVNCISKEELKNNLQKISFKKPSNLTESFKLLNEKLNVSLVYENDYVKIIARPIFEGFGASIYYHGSDKKNIKEFNTKSIFWTSEIEFAKNWGKYIYKAQLDIGKCFIFNERSHFNWLLKKVGKFSYEDANGNEQYFTNYNEYIKSPLKDNNWEIVEDYTDIIKTAYNSMQVTENGTKNYAVFENKQIKLIGNATPRNLDEGYVQRKSEFANTGVMFDDDYIEFEVGMSYIDENNIKWTITDIKTDADGDQICIVESEDGRYDRISALILNIDMFDLDTKKPVFDEKYFKQEDIKKANNISEHSEIIIYTNDKKYTKIYECNKLDAIKDFTSKFNFYNALVPQYLIKNGFLEESIHHASQWKDEQGDEYIQQESFDGVIFKNVLDNCTPMGGSNNIIDEYIVWNPSQIKSVYNKGLWSPYSENVDECLNENVENKKISEEDVKEFKQHYENHKNLVNKYASKINKQYPNHDADKFSKELLIPYIKGFIWGKMNCTDEEWKSFKVAQELHYRNNAHHSQHWDKNSYFKAPDVRGKMPDEALYEMCADWCAMSEYYGNTPFEWADKNIGKLWKFDEHQIQVIYDTLHKMWDSNNTIKESLQTIETIHTPIYITNNVYDVIKLTNKIPSMRVLIDTNKNLYIIGNSLFNIHNQLFDYAIQAGYYNFKNQREKDEYWENLPAILIDENDYFSFDRKNDYFDDMIICKNFVVYYRTDDFLDTKLYKLLIEKYNGKHQINEMRVYAGSPTQYEKPSLIAIGSGEGNQAHGWGLYYALDRKVGEKYAKTFSVNKKTYFKGQLIKWNDTGVYLGNKKINQKDNETLYNFFANVTSYTIPDYREELNYLIKDYELSLKHWNSMGNNNSQMLENIKKRIKQKKIQLKLLDYIKQEPSYVYTCDIPENGYLYEDRTLNQQFPSIKDKLYKINNIFNLEFEDTDTGQEIYSKMVYAFETSKKASMVLLKYGIKGITYVGEQDGRCFVIFNPKDVQVLDVKRFKLNEYFQNYGILYHGTDASFDNFNKDYQNGGYLGKGFYFTMNKSMAKSYGNNIIQAKLNYKNSFFFNVDTLSNNMIIEMLDTTQAQNYQKERILNLYHSLVNDNGFYDANSKLFDFVDTFNGDSTLILQKYGYDSIDNIDRDSEFVVFEPEQIQIIF